MTDDEETIDLEVEFVTTETAKAYLLIIDGEEGWIAKSKVIDDPGLSPGDKDVMITVPLWIAKDKGWA